MKISKNEKKLEITKLEVLKSEKAFAKSMADRDIDSFAYWLSEEAIFFTTITFYLFFIILMVGGVLSI